MLIDVLFNPFIYFSVSHVYTQPIHHKHNATKGQFLSSLTGLKSAFFLFETSCQTKVKVPACPTIYLSLEGEQLDSDLSQEY